MAHSLRYLQAAVLLLTISAFLSVAVGGPYDPPPTYYSTATGTGTTLKQQLDDIMTSGHSLLTYGAARFILDDTDEDPSNSANVLLTYNRNSVSGTWAGGVPGTLFNSREHVWPSSFRPDGSPSNGTTSIGSDLHMLKPLNVSTNSSRSNRPFAFGDTTGSNGTIGPTYYFPGDADKGDSARIMFYGATRWKDEGLDLVNGAGNSATYDMGDLASLIVWHFLDTPDDFELRRNHLIDGQQSNRNAYIDRPEYMWSVFVDQENDSQLYVGGAPGGDGGSTFAVELGPVIVGSAVPSAQNVTLNKNGFDGSYYEVTTTGDATSSVTGRYNAFAISASSTDSTTLSVGLNTTTGVAGQQSGSVVIDNLDVTLSGGAGRGVNDADDTIIVSLDVFDHAEASFAGASNQISLTLDFGMVIQGSNLPTLDFDIFNLVDTVGFTADLELDSFLGTGDASILTTDLMTFTGGSSLAAGSSNMFTATLDTSAAGAFSATYTLSFSDEDLPGATALADLTLNLMGTVGDADFDDDNDVDGVDFLIWQRGLGIGSTHADGDANEDNVVDAADLAVWEAQYGTPPPLSASSAVPEPASAVLVLLGLAWRGGCRARGRAGSLRNW